MSEFEQLINEHAANKLKILIDQVEKLLAIIANSECETKLELLKEIMELRRLIYA